MRGPPMPANSMPGRRAFSAAMRCAARRSPDASPATMPTRKVRTRGSRFIGLADDAALGAREKIEDLAHVRALGDLCLQLSAGVLEAEAAAIQGAIGALQRRDVVRGKAAPLEPFAVDAVGLCHVAGGGDERRQ